MFSIHKATLQDLLAICALGVMVSDRYPLYTETNGNFLTEQTIRSGHYPTAHRIVPDEPAAIAVALDELCESMERLIIFNGSTGISQQDVIYGVIQAKLPKTLHSFGELLCM